MTDPLDTFRADLRDWLEANCPAEMREPSEGDEADFWGGRNARPTPAQKQWLDAMVSRGFTVPTWPREYGGAGLSAEEARILQSELIRIGARPALKSFGIWMLAPVLLEYGNEVQRREHLPKIARGDLRWCQGYSEPDAGSDLASLKTRAVRDGDHYVVTGQKVWTSQADKSDWMFCLVRTREPGPGVARQDGISFILIDMATPGVRVRPIRLISGASPFCETFFDDVRVPAENLVGPEHGGWTIAKALLSHERAAISQLRDTAVHDEETLEALALRHVGTDEHGRLADPALRDRLAQAALDFLCNRLTLRRSAERARAGKGPGEEASMFKLYGTELNQRRKELRVAVKGYLGLGWEGPGFADEELRYTREWLRSRANTIEGGTSEVQLNIIAKRVLGLPD